MDKWTLPTDEEMDIAVKELYGSWDGLKQRLEKQAELIKKYPEPQQCGVFNTWVYCDGMHCEKCQQEVEEEWKEWERQLKENEVN